MRMRRYGVKRRISAGWRASGSQTHALESLTFASLKRNSHEARQAIERTPLFLGRAAMTLLSVLATAANLASVLTALVACAAFTQFHWGRRAKRLRLETFLKDVSDAPDGMHSVSVIGLSNQLGISEAEILEASFRSQRIRRQFSQQMMGQEPR